MDKKTADGKSMTQKDLATAVNAKPQDVRIALRLCHPKSIVLLKLISCDNRSPN